MGRFAVVDTTLRSELAKPYAYGSADCFLMGCQMADALDMARALVSTYGGSYRTLMSAQRALRKQGCKSLVDLFARHLTPCAPAQAALGDIVILDVGGAEHVGVCLSSTRYVPKTETGPAYFGLGSVKAAFRT